MIKANAHASNYSFQGQGLENFIVQREMQKENDMHITLDTCLDLRQCKHISINR